MRWVTAQDLQLWAGRLDAESTLPELLRRLVHATATPDRISFPSGESVQTGGWDGIVHIDAGNEYVPDGWSGWELSKRADIKTKADDDYQKRTDDSEHLAKKTSTFVFVTPRRWNAKEDWANAKKAEREWRDVRAYDADDLEQWLERAPAVGAWLARMMGKYPAGVVSIDDFWTEYSVGTTPHFTPGIVLAGRENDAQQARAWLQGQAGTLFVVADSPREAFALMAASTNGLGTEEQASVNARFLLADDITVLRELVASPHQLIIGWLSTDTASVGLAVHRGHRVVMPAREDQQRGDTITASRAESDTLSAALQQAGIPEDRAKTLVRESGRSITVLHRQLDTAPAPPAWAKPETARELIPALLVGAWDEKHPADHDVLATLAGTDYASVAGIAARWSRVPDAPIQQTGTVWAIRAPRDAWHLLNPYLTKNDLDRCRQAALAVFAIADPSLELPPDERWFAGIREEELPHSLWLRRGLAQTLIQLSLTPTIAGYRGTDIALGIVHEILQGDWQRWYALEPVLPHLAEAAPTTFLTALEHELAQDPDGIDNLFQQQGPMHGDHATGLLWALELLAWYPEHLTRTTLILGKLARKHKRPKDILRAIFLTWLLQTGATTGERNAALTLLLQREPEVAWGLLLALWPEHHSVGSYHYQPQWREKPANRLRTIGERNTAALAIIDLALQATNADPQRLSDLIKHLGTAPSTARARLRDQLDHFTKNNHDDAARALVWNTLREETSKHRHFHDAQWALPEAEIALFEPLLVALAPADPVTRNAWLFNDMFPMLSLPDADHHATEAALLPLRAQAAQEIVTAQGVPGIRAFAITIAYPFVLGMASATTDAAEDAMLALLADEQERAQICGMGYVQQRHQQAGMAWVDATLAKHQDWTPTQRAILFLGLPNNSREVWDRVDAQGVATEYWSRARVFLGRDATPEDITYVLTHLLAADQIPQALEQASMAAAQAPTPILTQVLDRVLAALHDAKQPWGHMLSYYLVQILNALDQREDIDSISIARYEWAYLPLLREERNLRLHEHLASAPDLFADMIKSVYRAANEKASTAPTQTEIARAHQAYELLASWHTIPGTNPDGRIDQERLIGWADAARDACNNRRDACDNHIGQVLAYAPNGADGVWPHESVRALLEHLNSPSVESGFRNGVFNKRGVTMKDPLAGGEQERALAAQYRAWAQVLHAAWPRTAAALAELAEDYERFAHQEDTRAQHLRLEHG
jgi:hypothetical protein